MGQRLFATTILDARQKRYRLAPSHPKTRENGLALREPSA
jgi:hypothetical protein